MAIPSIIGIQPNLFRILRSALDRPMEYVFPTSAAATRARAELNRARKKFRSTGHPFVPAFDTLILTGPRERPCAPRADGSTTEWYWRIGENLIFEEMQAQLEAHCVANGIDPSSYDPPSPQSFEPEPSIPLAPDAVRDGDTPPALAPTYAPIDPTRLRASTAGTARESAADAVASVVGRHNAQPKGEPPAPSAPSEPAKTPAELMRESIERAKQRTDLPIQAEPLRKSDSQ